MVRWMMMKRALVGMIFVLLIWGVGHDLRCSASIPLDQDVAELAHTQESGAIALAIALGGEGIDVYEPAFAPGEAVRLSGTLDMALPTTIRALSGFLRNPVTFRAYNPDGSLLFTRAEPLDLDGRSVIAFMLPQEAEAGTYKASASYHHKGNLFQRELRFTVDPDRSFEPVTRTGLITEDEVWSGTVHITGDLAVDHHATVTIEPGTTVFVAAHSDDQQSGEGEDRAAPHFTTEYARSHTSIRGSLLAQGTQDDRVFFTSDSLEPHHADWHEFVLLEGTTLEHTIVEYAQVVAVEEHSRDTVVVTHSVIRHILTAGIGINAPATVTHNYIYDAGHESIDISPMAGQPYIANNVIFHSSVGIFNHASPVIEHNLLIDNDRGICAFGGQAVIYGNVVASPKGAPRDWTYGEFAYQAYALHGMADRIRGIVIQNASPQVRQNLVGAQPVNVEILYDSTPLIELNSIIRGDTGVLISQLTGAPIIRANNICENSNLNVQLERTAVALDARHNWWGTPNRSAVQRTIRDHHHDRSLGNVQFDPVERAWVEVERDSIPEESLPAKLNALWTVQAF